MRQRTGDLDRKRIIEILLPPVIVFLVNSAVYWGAPRLTDTSEYHNLSLACVVTMAPIVNKDVAEAGVKSLTKEQLISIFTGKTTNWKDVGGPDEDIVLVTRPESSGTRATFQKYALDGNEEASNTSMETDDSGVLLTNVKSTNGAIGYVALSYLTGDAGVETVAIDDVEPTLENTYSGKYPVWTFEHMYTKGEPNEVTKAFLDYITGDEYGAQMEKLGYGVASKMTATEH